MSATQTQTSQCQAREAKMAISHAKYMARQLAEHQWGTGILWMHPSNQAGLVASDLRAARAAASIYTNDDNRHSDFPQPGIDRAEIWDNFVDAYIDQSYVVLSREVRTQTDMKRVVGRYTTDIAEGPYQAVTQEEVPEYFIACVRSMQSEAWEERALALRDEYETRFITVARDEHLDRDLAWEERVRELIDQWREGIWFGDNTDIYIIDYFEQRLEAGYESSDDW